eukprot:s11182_g2.t1
MQSLEPRIETRIGHVALDIAIMKQMHKHEAQVQSLREIFAEIDTDCSNMITLAELKDALRGHKLKNFMESMNISTQDVWTLFMLPG